MEWLGQVHSTGMEIRFKMTDGEADIFLRTEVEDEAATAQIFFGSFQGGWEYPSKNIGPKETRIHIKYPDNMELLKRMTEESALPFSPEVVRIIMPYTPCYYVRVDGKGTPPIREEMLKETYLAYGSSITHGSLGLIQPYSYPFRISQMLKCDYINLGHVGCALMEPEFATSIFRFNGEESRQTLGTRRRDIVKKYAESRLHFTEGLELLDNPAYISADMTHPSLEGMEQISHGWADIMRQELGTTY